MKKITTFFTACIFIMLLNAQTTKVYYCAKDATLGYSDGQSINNNYGSLNVIAAFAVSTGNSGPGAGNFNRSLFAFDVDSSLTKSSIDHAYINLYGHGSYGILSGHEGTANACWLLQVKQSWDEYKVTWANAPLADTAYQVSLGNSSSTKQNYLKIDVTNLVKDMVSKNRMKFGFMLVLKNETPKNSLVFNSRDNSSDTSIWPKLIITTSSANSTLAITPNPADFKVYPNPTSGQINIEGNFTRNSKITIVDALGKVVYFTDQINPENNLFTIDLAAANISRGTYYIKNQDGQKVVCKALVVN